MKQGIGFTATINIIAIFIVVTFAFLAATVTYYKAYKVNNAISDSIEKFEGYNSLAIEEIDMKLGSLGYLKGTTSKCDENHYVAGEKFRYCVEKITKDNIDENNYYRYKVVTFININLPAFNLVLDIPIKSTTEKIYYFNEGTGVN